MKRALNVRDILNKKYKVFPFEGKWRDALIRQSVRVYGSCGGQVETARVLL